MLNLYDWIQAVSAENPAAADELLEKVKAKGRQKRKKEKRIRDQVDRDHEITTGLTAPSPPADGKAGRTPDRMPYNNLYG